MDRKPDLESQSYAMVVDSSTPLISKENTSYQAGHEKLPARRPSPRGSWKANIFGVACIVLGVGLLLLRHELPTSFVDFPDRVAALTREDILSAFRKPSSRHVIKVKTLPQHLLPTTHIHHASSNRRLVVVGDVHGVDTELTQLLSKISFNASHDHLILAGDMINKGPSSHGVIQLARSLGASGVRGNHEDKILRIREAYDADPSAFVHDDSRDVRVAKELSKKDVKWLQECPLVLRVGSLPGHRQKETVVVHAGLLPLVGLDRQEPFDVMHMRSISILTGKGKGKGKHHKHPKVQFRAYEDRHEGDAPWWKVWNKVQYRLPKDDRTLVIYGHDSHTGFIEQDWSIGLDSGCVAGGKLSAVIIEGEDEKTGKPRMKFENVKCKAYR